MINPTIKKAKVPAKKGLRLMKKFALSSVFICVAMFIFDLAITLFVQASP
ncbi:hypothetical protein KIS4809_5700 [Bacillus sp. ZZV12-4809]|nr:hypothetical protein KIS4809_5700 [Bacillus sp. ZZV12-4809]